METAASFGMKLAEPIVLAMTTDDPKAWCESIAKKHAESPLQLVVCCFIDKKRDYEQMKRFLSCELGVPNQCMAFDTYFRNKKPLTVAQNIAKQINAKLGKAAYLVEKPAALKKAMLIGIDVFHRTSSNQGSWAGFVSTVDEEFSQFYSDGIKHHRGEELMARAPEYVGKALVRFVEKNKYRPETIVIYRDGVGEGQVDKLI
jgi:aubergine-like protein